MGKAGQIVTQSLDGNLFDNLFQEIQLETSRAKLRRVAVDGHSFLILLVDFSNFVVVNSVSKRTLRFCTCDDRGDSYLSFSSHDLVFLFCDWEVSRLVSSFNGRRRKKTKRLVNPSRRGLERTISHLLFGLEGWESHCCYFVALLVHRTVIMSLEMIVFSTSVAIDKL